MTAAHPTVTSSTAAQDAHSAHDGLCGLQGLTVLERGWLSSNNILIHAAAGEAGDWLVDTGHVNHAAQTLALVQRALAGRPLAGIVNTHLHSDHCGGNATLQRALGAPLAIPPGQADAVAAWDEDALSYRATGQRVERFEAQQQLRPGEPLRAGGRCWQVLAAPGHDPHSVMLFDADAGVLISADALWGNGFGVVFPELAGEPGFDDVAAVLDLIASLQVRVVVPGHGAPFTDVAAALDRARSRLAAFRARPERHARYAFKVLVKYHLMERGAMPEAELLPWARATPLLAGLWRLHGGADAALADGWCQALVDELVLQGALARRGSVLHDA
jgi:glyoxylase-like metal-dependent hydrolase (beta-lactamase superfamily II)